MFTLFSLFGRNLARCANFFLSLSGADLIFDRFAFPPSRHDKSIAVAQTSVCADMLHSGLG